MHVIMGCFLLFLIISLSFPVIPNIYGFSPYLFIFSYVIVNSLIYCAEN